MTTRAKLATASMAVVLALTLAACGSEQTPTTANITFKTTPAAEVWIDGKSEGMAPIVIAVGPGFHDVVLKAPGFKNESARIQVEVGKDLTVDTGLTVEGTDVAAYKRLLASLSIDSEPYGTLEAHRGSVDKVVMLYWPSGNIRRDAASTYRLEVTPDYADDGTIEFRKGKQVLHREHFKAHDLTTEHALPAKVIEALKRKGTYSWGVYFDSKRKKPIVQKFKVVDGRKMAKRLERIRHHQVYRRANPLMRAMAEIDELRNRRFYAEALSRSLSVVNTWPQTEIPFKSIAFCLRRLKLKQTQLYQDVSSALLGKGVSARRPDLSGGNRTSAQGGQTSDLPPSLIAPRVKEPKAGLSAGGVGVTPTPEAQKRAPGPIVPAPTADGEDAPGVTVDPRTGLVPDKARDAEIQGLKDELAQAEQDAADAKEANERAAAVSGALNSRKADLETKELASETATAALDALLAKAQATPGSVTAAEMQAAKDAVTNAQGAVDGARADVAAAEQAAKQAADALREVKERAGTAEDSAHKVEELKDKLEAAQSGDGVKPRPIDPTTGQPGVTLDPATGKPIDPKTGGTSADNLADQIASAQSGLDSALEALGRDQQEFTDATQAAGQAHADMATAQKALDDAIAAGKPQSEIDTLERDVGLAAAEAARADMDVERTGGNVERATQVAGEAKKLVEAAEAGK